MRNKLQWNLKLNSYIFIQENAFENVVWKMVAILSWPQCVKSFLVEHKYLFILHCQYHGCWSPELNVAKIFYLADFENNAIFRSASIKHRRKQCSNPLAWPVVLLALGHQAMGYVEPWCPSDARNKGISGHGIDIVLQKYQLTGPWELWKEFYKHIFNSFYKLISWAFAVILVLGRLHTTLLKVS